MRVLLTGASGYLGQHLLVALDAAGHTVHGTYATVETLATLARLLHVELHPLDLADAQSVRAVLEASAPEVVIHCAALSSPVACERDVPRAKSVNCPVELLDALPPNAAVIFLSTDQVYDGHAAPYSEQSATEPVNEYGRTKLAFEGLLQQRLPQRFVVLRSSLIIGHNTPSECRKQSFLQFCDERLSAGIATEFFSDEIRSVVHVSDVCEVVVRLVRRISMDSTGGVIGGIAGVYNMGGPRGVARDEIAREVAKWRGHNPSSIRPVRRFSEDLPFGPLGGVPSPPDITMDSSRLSNLLGLDFRALDRAVSTSFPR